MYVSLSINFRAQQIKVEMVPSRLKLSFIYVHEEVSAFYCLLYAYTAFDRSARSSV